MKYTLKAQVNGNNITLTYRNYTIAIEKLVQLGKGKLYFGRKLVDEL